MPMTGATDTVIPDALAELRRRIDAIDDGLIALLAERQELARQVAACKRLHTIPVRIPERIAAVIDRCAEEGSLQDLDPRFIRALWALIVEETCRLEERLLA